MKNKPLKTPEPTDTSAPASLLMQDILDAMVATRDRALGMALNDCASLRAELVAAQREIQTLKNPAEK